MRKFLEVLAALVLSTIALSGMVLFWMPNYSTNNNLLVAYFESVSHFFLVNPIWNLLYITVFLIVFVGFTKKPQKDHWLIANSLNLIYAGVISWGVEIIAMFLSLVIVYLAAVFNVYMFAQKINWSPDSAGLITQRSLIVDKLQEVDKVPKITLSTPKNFPQVVEDEYFSIGAGGFYRKRLVTVVPAWLVKFNFPQSDMYWFNGRLVFVNLTADDLAAVSPRLGYLMLKNYFQPREVKNSPVISILNRQEYLKVRGDQINQQVSDVGNLLDKATADYDKSHTELSAALAEVDKVQAKVLANQKSYNLDYQLCLTAGYQDIFVNKFIYYHDATYCKNKAELEWGNLIASSQKDLTEANKVTDDLKIRVKAAADSQTTLQNYKMAVAAQNNSLPDELGFFRDNNKIDVALDWVNSTSIIAYLQTLTHEYLHYASYVSDKRVLPRAFEEGLTEYFARKTMAAQLGVSMTLGYPVLVKVVGQIARKVPEQTLQTIYFTKDETELARQLNLAFGSNFYNEFAARIELIPYLDPEKSVETGNQVITQMGGVKITQQDLRSEINAAD